MSLDERIAEAFARADVSLDPTDHAMLHALEAIKGAEIQAAKFAANPPQGDTSDLPPWSEVSKPYGDPAAEA
jgi:hypothetical protein